MNARISRRGWLREASLLTGAIALTGGRLARGIEPIQRDGVPKFKYSLAAYSYRDLLTGTSPQLTLEDFIRDCAKMGLEGTELTSYYFPANPTNEYLCQLKRLAFELGLDVSGTAVGNDFCYPPGEKRDQEIAGVKRWIEHAAVLDAPVIRIFSGNAKEGQSAEEAHRLAVAGMEECCAAAGERGVMLALENHGGLTETAEGMLSLVRDVQSPWFGVNLDTGNFRTADPYSDLAKLAPYAVNVQVKVVTQPNGGKKEPANFKRLSKMLADVGYRGYIVLEFEEDEDPRAACPRYVEELRAAGK